MKRSPLVRGTSRLQRQPMKRGKGNPIPAASRRAVAERSGGQCEARLPVCTGRAEHLHHRTRRRDGGHHPDNLLAACSACHREIHSQVAASVAAGLIRRATEEAA